MANCPSTTAKASGRRPQARQKETMPENLKIGLQSDIVQQLIAIERIRSDIDTNVARIYIAWRDGRKLEAITWPQCIELPGEGLAVHIECNDVALVHINTFGLGRDIDDAHCRAVSGLAAKRGTRLIMSCMGQGAEWNQCCGSNDCGEISFQGFHTSVLYVGYEMLSAT